MSSLKDRRRRGTENAFTASGLDKTGDIVAQINAPRPADAAIDSMDAPDQQTLPEALVVAEVKEQVETGSSAKSDMESNSESVNEPIVETLSERLTEPLTKPLTKPLTEPVVETVSESVAEKVMRRLAAPRKSTPTLATAENADHLSGRVENPALDITPKDITAEEVDTRDEDRSAVEGLTPPTSQLVQEQEEALEVQQEPVHLIVESPPSGIDAKPPLTAWEKLAAINANAKRSAPSSRRYIAHVPSELFDECRTLRGDWPITTWFVSLVAKYHEQVVKDLVGSTPDASLGVVPHRVYRKRKGSTKCFLLYFASNDLGLAQQAFFQECLSSAGTTTEYIVAVLQSHADASRSS